jgi:small basic protein
MFLLPFGGLLTGILIGYLIQPVEIPVIYNKYILIVFITCLTSIMRAWRAGLEKNFRIDIFLTGFIVNTLAAFFLTCAGERLGIDLYIAVTIIFGINIFNNLGNIIKRSYVFSK